MTYDALYSVLSPALSVPVYRDVAPTGADPTAAGYVVLASDTAADAPALATKLARPREATVTVRVYAPDGDAARALSASVAGALTDRAAAAAAFGRPVREAGLDLDATGPPEPGDPIGSRVVVVRYLLP